MCIPIVAWYSLNVNVWEASAGSHHPPKTAPIRGPMIGARKYDE